MKNLIALLLCLVLISSGCKKDEKSATPSGTPTTSSMTSWETSLVGQWKLKRTEIRTNSFLPGLGDSTFTYKNHYNYLYSQLELSSTPFTGTAQYSGVMGTDDGNPADVISWSGGTANSITIGSTPNFFIVKYLTTDSMVLDFGGGTARYFYNKLTTPPIQNAIESQLIGAPWQLVSTTPFGGSPTFPTNPTYKMFFSNWLSDDGYYGKDSIYVMPTFSSVAPDAWEVLFPQRAVPIFNSVGTSYCKITNLTPTSLTLESIANPNTSSTTGITYVYSR